MVLIVFVKSCLQIQKTKNPGPMATPSVMIMMMMMVMLITIKKMILNSTSMMMIEMIVKQLKLAAVLEGEPFAGAFKAKRYSKVSLCALSSLLSTFGLLSLQTTTALQRSTETPAVFQDLLCCMLPETTRNICTQL